MTTPVDVLLQPRDPIIARDARPFSADPGARAFTLDWPLPSTFAGALRTYVGNAVGVDWQDKTARTRARPEVEIQGALLVDRRVDEFNWTVYVPAPADAVVYIPDGKTDPRIMRLRPDESLLSIIKDHEETARDGTSKTTDESFALVANLPHVNGIRLAPVVITAEEKPERDYAYWSLADTMYWLQGSADLPTRYRASPSKESRVHVGVSPETLTSAEGRLFATTGLAFGPEARKAWDTEPGTAILCRVATAHGTTWVRGHDFLPLGGERRQARISPKPNGIGDPWAVPVDIVTKLTGATRLRLQLVTPAIFRQGWRPGWLTQTHRDRMPGPVRGLGLTLRAACVGRRIPISGWDYTHQCEKPIRYAAPAGSTYFFETREPLTVERVRELWLASLSDGGYNRQDGFGIVVPGIW